MKNILKSALLLLCSVCIFTACEDDNDSNPTLVMPSTFQLNTPAYSQALTDLATSTTLPFTWSQPNYGGFPAAAQYQMQFSLKNSFTTSVAEAQTDESGATVADYVMLDQIYNGCQGTVDAGLLAKGLQQIAGWKESEVPASATVYARLTADYANDTIYSNVVSFKVAPYYVELKDAAPLLWYLVGNCIADGSWGNSPDGVGKTLIPLFTIAGEEYDKATGTGLISFTGFFPEGGQFKLIQTPGSWDTQLNFTNVDDPALVDDLDGDNHNIGFKKAGYYTVKLDTKTNKVYVEAYDGTARTFSQMGMPGGLNGWDTNSNLLTAGETYDGAENHFWYGAFNADADGEVKFAADNGWDFNWGGTDFPYGTGVQGGANIPYKAGSYTVYMNDITGQYMFIANE